MYYLKANRRKQILMNSREILREYIRSIAFPASNVKHKMFLYRAQPTFPYKTHVNDDDLLDDDEINEDDMIYVMKPRSSKNSAGSKRGWFSGPVPIPTKKKKKDYFSLKSLLNIDKNFNNSW